ncbi:MAG: hypothetical protein RLZ55_1344 [Actinomycetota bacterium]
MAGAEATHCDRTDLALVAIGEAAPTPVFDRHMRSCPACAAELDGLVEVMDLGRAASADRAYAQPPGAVWASVQEAVAAGPPAVAAGAGRGSSSIRWSIGALVALVLALLALAVVLLG